MRASSPVFALAEVLSAISVFPRKASWRGAPIETQALVPSKIPGETNRCYLLLHTRHRPVM
jgi:hypothetical protein